MKLKADDRQQVLKVGEVEEEAALERPEASPPTSSETPRLRLCRASLPERLELPGRDEPQHERVMERLCCLNLQQLPRRERLKVLCHSVARARGLWVLEEEQQVPGKELWVIAKVLMVL